MVPVWRLSAAPEGQRRGRRGFPGRGAKARKHPEKHASYADGRKEFSLISTFRCSQVDRKCRRPPSRQPMSPR
jgi:hypothetical protein